MTDSRLISDKIEVEDSLDSIENLYYERGMTDGLPIVPPTEERIKRMLAGVNRDPQEVISILAPRSAAATVEKIAINAVMAGCLPEYMPVIIAAVESCSDDKFNLSAVQGTTHPCGTMILVNGPIAGKLGIASRASAFGPGNRANATIGRALRLILLNVGGGIPTQTDKSTQGSPVKYSYCVAENEAENPWTPLHVERGFKPEDSAVTVFSAEGPHNVNDHNSLSGKGVLTSIAGTMAAAGNNNLTYYMGEPIVGLGPEHASNVFKDGFTKEMIKDFLFEKARLPVSMISEENLKNRRESPQLYGEFTNADFVPVAKRKDILVIVVGGAGKHSVFIPSFGMSMSTTKLVRV